MILLNRVSSGNLRLFGSFFAKICKPFSIKGKLTFGHNLELLQNQPDIYLDLITINNQYAKNKYLITKRLPIQITKGSKDNSKTTKQTTQKGDTQFTSNKSAEEDQSDIFQKPSIRKFNIFEVIAHALHIEIEQKIRANPKQLNQPLHYFYDRLELIVQSLIKDNANLDPKKKHLSYCHRQIARQQIEKRFYQMCKHYSSFDIKQQMLEIIKQMQSHSQNIAEQIKNYILYSTDFNKQSKDPIIRANTFPIIQAIIKIINDLSPTKEEYLKLQTKQNQIHYLVGDKFRSMFSTDIEKQYFSPIRTMQKRFQDNSGQLLIDEKGYYTTSFIATSLTTKIFKLLGQKGVFQFIAGFRRMGKSHAIFLFFLLQCQIGLSRYLYIPQLINLDQIGFAIWPIIVEVYWRVISPQQFQNIQNQLIEHQRKGASQQEKLQLTKSIIHLLKQNTLSTIVFDQFSSIVAIFYKKNMNFTSNPAQIALWESFYKFYQKYHRLTQFIFCSSISVEKQQIQNNFVVDKNSKIFHQIQEQFSNEEAYEIIKIWANKQLNAYLFVNPLMSKMEQMKKRQYKNSFTLKINEQIQKLRSFLKKQQEGGRGKQLEGSMELLKLPARVIFNKIKNQNKNKQSQIEIDWQKQIVKYSVQFYQNQIKDWIKKGENNFIQNVQNDSQKQKKAEISNLRKLYVLSLLKHGDYREVKILIKDKNFYPPYFMSTRKGILRNFIIPFKIPLFQRIYEFLLQDEDQTRLNYFQQLKIQKHVNYGSSFGLQFQYLLTKCFYQNYQNSSSFCSKIVNFIFKNKNLVGYKCFHIHTNSQQQYVKGITQTVGQSITDQLKCNVFFYTSRFQMPSCDGMLVNIQKKRIIKQPEYNENKEVKKLEIKQFEYIVNVCQIQFGIIKHQNIVKKINDLAKKRFQYLFMSAFKQLKAKTKINLSLGSYDILLLNSQNKGSELKTSPEGIKIYQKNKNNNLYVFGVIDQVLYGSDQKFDNVQLLAQIYKKRLLESEADRNYAKKNCMIYERINDNFFRQTKKRKL